MLGDHPGAALQRNVEIATEYGLLDIPKDTVVGLGESRSLDDAQLAADLLGDKLKTVLDTYYRPDHDKLRREYFNKLACE